jgi:hypothetical protein
MAELPEDDMGIEGCKQDIVDLYENNGIKNDDETSTSYKSNSIPSINVCCGINQTQPNCSIQSKMDIKTVLSTPDDLNETESSKLVHESNRHNFLAETDATQSPSESLLPQAQNPDAPIVEKEKEIKYVDSGENFDLLSEKSNVVLEVHGAVEAVDDQNGGKNKDINFFSKHTALEDYDPSPQVACFMQITPLNNVQEATSLSEKPTENLSAPLMISLSCVSDLAVNQDPKRSTFISRLPPILHQDAEKSFGCDNNLNRSDIGDNINSGHILPEALHFEFVPIGPNSLWRTNVPGKETFGLIASQTSKIISIDPNLSIMQEEEGACARSFSRRRLLMCEKQMNEALSARSYTQEPDLKSWLANVRTKPLNHCSTFSQMSAEPSDTDIAAETNPGENTMGLDICLQKIFDSTTERGIQLDPMDISSMTSQKAFESSGLPVTQPKILKKMQHLEIDLSTENEEAQASSIDELNAKDDLIASPRTTYLAGSPSEVDNNLLSISDDALDVCLLSTSEETLDDELSAFMAAEGYTVLPVNNGTGAAHALSTATGSENSVQQISMSPKASLDTKYHVIRVHVAEDTQLAQVMFMFVVLCSFNDEN